MAFLQSSLAGKSSFIRKKAWSKNRLMEDPSVGGQRGEEGGETAGERDRKGRIEDELSCYGPRVNISCWPVVALLQ